jgi:hypothetical protein
MQNNNIDKLHRRLLQNNKNIRLITKNNFIDNKNDIDVNKIKHEVKKVIQRILSRHYNSISYYILYKKIILYHIYIDNLERTAAICCWSS